jgi:uncharacterized membrane protein
MLFSLFSIAYGGIGYRFFTDPQLKNLSLSAMILGTIGLILFLFRSSPLGNLWLVVEITNIVLWFVLFYYLAKLSEDKKDDNILKMMVFAVLGCVGVTGLFVGLIQFREKQKEKTELSKVRQVYERLTSNQ